MPRLTHQEDQATRAEITERFAKLADVWCRETAHLSSITSIILHPAYQQIIGLGRPAIPLILQRLREEPDHWSWALFAITGENPVRAEDAGNMERIREAWLQLAEEKGWLSRDGSVELFPSPA